MAKVKGPIFGSDPIFKKEIGLKKRGLLTP